MFIFIFTYDSALQINHASVFLSELEELCMCPAFYYFSFFENDDVISTFDCLESMSDDDDGAAFEEFDAQGGHGGISFVG